MLGLSGPSGVPMTRRRGADHGNRRLQGCVFVPETEQGPSIPPVRFPTRFRSRRRPATSLNFRSAPGIAATPRIVRGMPSLAPSSRPLNS
jgi:hypothetical protein